MVSIDAVVAEMPEQKNSQTRLRLTDICLNYSTKRLRSQVYVTLAGEYKDIQRSDRITLRGKVQNGFDEYDASIYKPMVLAINKPDPPDYPARIRAMFASRLRKIFNNSATSDLALGFLIGEKSLPQKLKEQLRGVGLSHIVVASGFSLSILAGFMKKWMSRISRFIGYASAFMTITLFLSITGLTPSLLRASLVSGISLIAEYYNVENAPRKPLFIDNGHLTFLASALVPDLSCDYLIW